MEGERRKRKLLEEEEENDEEKMEKFFALIKNTRDLLSKPDKKVDEGKKEKSIWNPTFQLEDFIGCEELGKSNVSVSVTHDAVAGPSSEKEKEVMIIEKECVQEAAATTTVEAPVDQIEDKEKISDNRLDLNLSL
ncbi:protein NIM1-INTERACTING 1-like [Trifolium medium]|uniref:Protein NIM1-INTERACTING 1-like n=1 Tax=Trifolium medium TaxID=97028 RepID=A0A392P732_9FABA|nr:protein NIM1-INTERACTING 1-like [Trifolium medium]MCI07190.1 protein NIM1-INTERACTING 1-like [Trifolium medium]